MSHLIVVGVCVATLYGWLTRKDIKLKLPESVPPMVADQQAYEEEQAIAAGKTEE